MSLNESDTAMKIRRAIQQKLHKIDDCLDDSLPDYVMILVANQRSKSQMEKDLTLFLGPETIDFTNWLWDLLKSFKEGGKKPSIPDSRKDPKSEPSKAKVDDDDVLAYNPDEQEGDLLNQDEEKYSKKIQSIIPNKIQNKASIIKSVTTPSLPTGKGLINVVPKPHPILGEKDDSKKLQKSVKVYPMQKVSKTDSLKSKVVSVSATKPMVHNDQYDPTKPGIAASLSSVVRSSSRKKSGTAALQANKLLQKAVTDATKSILGARSLNDYYKPTPINLLSQSNVNNPELISYVKPLDSDTNVFENVVSEPYIVYDHNQPSVNIYTQENYIVTNASKNNRTICLPSIPDDVTFEEEEELLTGNIGTHEDEKSPHFIVTLDGVDFPSLKRKHSFIEEEPMEIDTFEDEIPPKKHKVSERCKFWPACKNSDECQFHHPTIFCKKFPNCSFGDKCLYIHPNCKFDALCSRKDCPFTHASKRKFNVKSIKPKFPFKIKSTKSLCKYFPNCTSANCLFFHPKLCRFGTQCRAPSCPFEHFSVPSRKELKWTANV